MLTRLPVFLLFFLTLSSSLPVYAQEARYYISSGKTLFNVRATVISTDPSSGGAVVRFSGADCSYCDRTYTVTETTGLQTRDYVGPMDLDLLSEMTFYSGTAEVFLDDGTVKEIRYVNTEE